MHLLSCPLNLSTALWSYRSMERSFSHADILTSQQQNNKSIAPCCKLRFPFKQCVMTARFINSLLFRIMHRPIWHVTRLNSVRVLFYSCSQYRSVYYRAPLQRSSSISVCAVHAHYCCQAGHNIPIHLFVRIVSFWTQVDIFALRQSIWSIYTYTFLCNIVYLLCCLHIFILFYS